MFVKKAPACTIGDFALAIKVEKLKVATIVGTISEIIRLSAVMCQKGEFNVKQDK